MTTESAAETSNEELTYGYYVVAYFDLLGQTNALKEMTELPKTKQEKAKFVKLAQRTLGAVVRFRTIIDQYYREVERHGLVEQAPDWATEAHRRTAEQLDAAPLRFQRFSDLILVYAPLTNPYGNISLKTVSTLLLSCTTIMNVAFADGLVPRGAIEVGVGVEIDDGDFYGRPLPVCYELEANEAGWPRILVGSGLLACLDDIADVDPGEDDHARVNSELAKWARDMLFEDVDGQRAVDYLAPRSVDGHGVEAHYMATLAQSKLGKMRKRNADRPRIAEKYRATRDYYARRLGPLTNERLDEAKAWFSRQGREP